MHEPGSGTSVPLTGVGGAALEAFLDETREVPAARLLALFARQVACLGVEPVVGPLGVQFRDGESTLCELSLYGELFIARVGPGLAVEYRVRSDEVALMALDHVLRAYVESALPAGPVTPSRGPFSSV